jgi:predicted nucleotidyltransferase component of viral defense system
LARLAADTGFQAHNLEKVLRLIDLLNGLRGHPFLRDRIVLKGGTALNLFLFDLPRLSVDIDLNFIGVADRQAMLEERPRVEQAIRAVCEREAYQVRRLPDEHAGGKWRLAYRTVDDRPGTLELDLNFLMRIPLWETQVLDSLEVGPLRATGITVLDIHELTAGKLAALLDRSSGRDLFDARNLLRREDLDAKKLRIAFVVYGGISRRDWREVGVQDVESHHEEFDRRLVPLLRAELVPDRSSLGAWTAELVAECRSLLSAVLPLRAEEVEFLARLNGHGEIAPGLLTNDASLQDRIARQPGLLWKALNVRRHFGSEAGAED